MTQTGSEVHTEIYINRMKKKQPFKFCVGRFLYLKKKKEMTWATDETELIFSFFYFHIYADSICINAAQKNKPLIRRPIP